MNDNLSKYSAELMDKVLKNFENFTHLIQWKSTKKELRSKIISVKDWKIVTTFCGFKNYWILDH
jgi:hypothetical protein